MDGVKVGARITAFMSRRVGNIDWREVLMNPVFGKRDQIICDCLFCGKSKHMYVNKNTGAWDCKKCGNSGGIYKLLAAVDKWYLLEGATIEEREVIPKIRDLAAFAAEDG